MSWVLLALLVCCVAVFAACQLVSQLATASLWRREKEATGSHAVFPWSIAYYVWMFSTPHWAAQDEDALVLLKRQRRFAAASLVAFALLMAVVALTGALS